MTKNQTAALPRPITDSSRRLSQAPFHDQYCWNKFAFEDATAFRVGSESMVLVRSNATQRSTTSGKILFTVKRQEILTQVSNCKNLRSCFAVFSTKRLHAHNVFQFFSLCYVQRVTRHEALHLEHSKHDIHSHNHTTIARKQLQSTKFVPRTRYTKGRHRASLRPAPSHSYVLGLTRRA